MARVLRRLSTASDDRGQAGQVIGAVPVLMLAVALALLLILRSSSATVTLSRADAAADAVALAFAGGGVPAATHVASRHGAVIVSIDRREGIVRVVVTVDGVTGRAAAERTERWVQAE